MKLFILLVAIGLFGTAVEITCEVWPGIKAGWFAWRARVEVRRQERRNREERAKFYRKTCQ